MIATYKLLPGVQKTYRVEITNGGTTHYFNTPYEDVADMITRGVNMASVHAHLNEVEAKEPEFSPDWVTAPGSTIRECLSEFQITHEAFGASMGLSESGVNMLLDGDLRITPDVAANLSRVLGAGVDFWLNRERNYRTGLAKGLQKITS